MTSKYAQEIQKLRQENEQLRAMIKTSQPPLIFQTSAQQRDLSDVQFFTRITETLT